MIAQKYILGSVSVIPKTISQNQVKAGQRY